MPKRLPINPIHGLNERQVIAARCLAAGKTIRYTAQEAGVSERWLYSWRQRPEMQREIQRLQGEMLDDAGGMNTSMQQVAISTLSEILVDPNARASDRINAARTLMSGSQAFAERKLLERKLADLEKQLIATLRDGAESEPEPVAAIVGEDTPEDALITILAEEDE